MKYIYRPVYLHRISEEVKAGNKVRICDKLLAKVYKVEEMTATDFIEVSESEDYSRYEGWVVEEAMEVEDGGNG